MAIRNMREEARQMNMKEAYNNFKEKLLENVGKISDEEFFLKQKLDEMEETIESQEKQINEYRSFFATLKSFMPRSFSSTTRIG